METNVRTPLDIFNLPQHLVVPLFERPYVWDEAEQWLPLWQDLRRLAELRLSLPGSSATHFLGAVVVQGQDNHVGALPTRCVIDGKQRLTTLQLLADAAGSVMEEGGLDAQAGQLETLTHNLEMFVAGGGTQLRHTNRDQAAFDEASQS